MTKDPPATLDEPDTDCEAIEKLRAEIERLRAALERIGSSEGMTGTFAIADDQTGAELKARMQFARDATQ